MAWVRPGLKQRNDGELWSWSLLPKIKLTQTAPLRLQLTQECIHQAEPSISSNRKWLCKATQLILPLLPVLVSWMSAFPVQPLPSWILDDYTVNEWPSRSWNMCRTTLGNIINNHNDQSIKGSHKSSATSQHSPLRESSDSGKALMKAAPIGCWQ